MDYVTQKFCAERAIRAHLLPLLGKKAGFMELDVSKYLSHGQKSGDNWTYYEFTCDYNVSDYQDPRYFIYYRISAESAQPVPYDRGIVVVDGTKQQIFTGYWLQN